ncbi:MAG: hypothetical protein IJG31_06560 [Fusobacterium sp.]|nr:hypothetical protein [Fusobacterium sp.]
MKKYEIKSIKDIIVEKLENDERMQVAFIRAKKEEIFDEIFDEIKIEYIKDKILYIRVKNSITNHYLYTNKNKILKRINFLISFIIEDIQIELR